MAAASGLAPTLEHFITKEWLPTLQVRPHTRRGYASKLRVHVLPVIGEMRVDRITPLVIRKLLVSLEDTLAPQTIAHVRAILRNALRRAEQDGYVTRNVVALTDPPKVPNVERRTLTVAEAQRFLVSLEGDRWEAFYLVAITLGLRESEIFGLRWSDVVGLGTAGVAQPGSAAVGTHVRALQQVGGSNPSASLHIRQTLHRVARKVMIEDPKTPRSRRDIPVPADVAEALRRHKANQRAEYLASGARPKHDLVFTTKAGRAIAASTLLRDLYRRLDALTIERVTFHNLRHAAASMLHARGLTPREVMAILGHASIATTMNTYTRSMPRSWRRR